MYKRQGSHTRKIIKCFNEYGVDIAIKKSEMVFDKIRNKNIEKIPVLQKSGIYKLKCKDCNKVYLGCLLYTSAVDESN